MSRNLFPIACPLCQERITQSNRQDLELACGCRQHASCLEAQLAAGFVTPYVTDRHLRCCSCNTCLDHPQLHAQLLPWRKILHRAQSMRHQKAQELGLDQTPNWRVTWCPTHRQAQLVEETVGCLDAPPPCRKCVLPHCPGCQGQIEHDGGCALVRHCTHGAHGCGWEGWDAGSLWEHEATGEICTQDQMTDTSGYHLHTYRPQPCTHGGLCGTAWDVATGEQHSPHKPLTPCPCDRCRLLHGVHFDGSLVGYDTHAAWVRSFVTEDAAESSATDGAQ